MLVSLVESRRCGSDSGSRACRGGANVFGKEPVVVAVEVVVVVVIAAGRSWSLSSLVVVVGGRLLALLGCSW